MTYPGPRGRLPWQPADVGRLVRWGLHVWVVTEGLFGWWLFRDGVPLGPEMSIADVESRIKGGAGQVDRDVRGYITGGQD